MILGWAAPVILKLKVYQILQSDPFDFVYTVTFILGHILGNPWSL